MAGNGDADARVGAPGVAGAIVRAEVVEHIRGEKIIVFRYKSKVRYRRKTGHRQSLTRLRITDILVDGHSSIAADERSKIWFHIAMAVTGLLGLAFLIMEIREFADLVARGYGPTRSAFLSAFFTLVGCHGLHVSAGILWLLTMMAQVYAKGFRADIQRRFLCFALFWHALDIIWVAVFSVVYLLGSLG